MKKPNEQDRIEAIAKHLTGAPAGEWSPEWGRWEHWVTKVQHIIAADPATAYLKEQEWIPVGERLPKPQVRVLMLYNRSLEIEIGSWSSRDDDELVDVWWGDQHILGSGDITHWRPLPAPPELSL